MASTELQDDHHDATKGATRFPVDHITQQENCEIQMLVANIKLKVAAGFALPCKGGSYHTVRIPDGYAVVEVDQVVKD